jgi:hypothetical protein
VLVFPFDLFLSRRDFLFRSLPPSLFLTRVELQKFANDKKHQFYWDLLVSGLYALLLSCAWIFIAAPESLDWTVVQECVLIITCQLGVGLVVSFLA